MLNKYRTLSKTMLSVLIALGAGAIAVSAHQQANADPVNGKIMVADKGTDKTIADKPVYCEIKASTNNGMTTIEGVFHTDIALDASYRFTVASSGRSGNSNISQGGNFSAQADDALTLGRVMMGGQGAVYNASLEVTTSQNTIVCANRTGDNA